MCVSCARIGVLMWEGKKEDGDKDGNKGMWMYP
jgi:hypothetical protein